MVQTRLSVIPRLATWCMLATLVPNPIFAQDAPDSLLSVLERIDPNNELSVFRNLAREYRDELYSNFVPGGVTVLAPNNFAFDKLGGWQSLGDETIHALLKYHILTRPITMSSIIKGDSMFAATRLSDPNHSNVTGGQQLILTKQPGGEVVFTSGYATRGTVMAQQGQDVPFDGGVIQVIDSVMHIPQSFKATALDAYTDLKLFLSALVSTDLINEITPDMTIFAPSNDAFSGLTSIFDSMSMEKFRRVIRYHMVPGVVLHSWDLVNGSAVVTSDELLLPLNITRHANSIFANSAKLVQTDILVSNGLVQMIDNVLNPDRPDARPDPDASVQPPVFGASDIGPAPTGTRANLPTTLPSDVLCDETECTVETTSTRTTRPLVTASKDVSPPKATGVGIGVGVGLAVCALVMAL